MVLCCTMEIFISGHIKQIITGINCHKLSAESLPGGGPVAGASRPALQATLMQRMTDALSRMLNDPTTRLAMQRVGQAEGGASGEEHGREGASSEAEDARDIRDSLNLSEAEARGEGDSQQNRHTRAASAASAIQERWR